MFSFLLSAVIFFFFFFFSSRRRHTRFDCDWSSDVCSSDLLAAVTTLLNRSITIATEAATGTVSDAQRIALNDEFTAIKSEIDRVGSKTNYNGGQVFTANTLNVFLSDSGATSNSTIGVTTGLLSSTGLSLGGAVAASGTLTQAAGSAAIAATDTLTGGAFTASAVATGTLTATGAPVATNTATVNGQVYTFVAALTGAANEVLVGGTVALSLSNLAAAINATSGGAGVAYGAGTVANTAVTATSTATTVVVTAKVNGTAGNGITTTAAGGTFTFGAGSTAGGTAGSTVTVGGKTYTFVAALSNTATANEVISSSEATGLANLASAVNAGTGSGTTYSTPTTQNTSVSAGTATATTLLFTALSPGTGGNFLTGSATVGSFGTANFAGGVNTGAAPVAAAGNTVTVGTQTYTFVTALSTTPTANEVLVGATETASLANLANAVNGGTGSGATYGSPTVANTSASAVATASTVVFTALPKASPAMVSP